MICSFSNNLALKEIEREAEQKGTGETKAGEGQWSSYHTLHLTIHHIIIPSHHHIYHHISTITPSHHHTLTPSPPCVQSELELLVMGEDEGREHFSLKGILKEEGKEAGGRKKRKRRRKGEELEVGVNIGTKPVCQLITDMIIHLPLSPLRQTISVWMCTILGSRHSMTPTSMPLTLPTLCTS